MWLGIGVKRIIFSQYSNNIDQTTISSNQYKLEQFRKYKDKLVHVQQEYATRCNADYVLHNLNITDYDTIQFEKILQLERYAEKYDQILYLDMDVIPHRRAPNIFDMFNDTLAMHPTYRELEGSELKWHIKNNMFDNQNVFCKTCAKNSMLILDDCQTSSKLYNTGVVYGSSSVIQNLNFSSKLKDMKYLIDEAKTDSLYPEAITENFFYNNEIFITYLIEKYNIPCNDLNIQWNYILDGFQRKPTDSAYFIHHVNKEFEISFP